MCFAFGIGIRQTYKTQRNWHANNINSSPHLFLLFSYCVDNIYNIALWTHCIIPLKIAVIHEVNLRYFRHFFFSFGCAINFFIFSIIFHLIFNRNGPSSFWNKTLLFLRNFNIFMNRLRELFEKNLKQKNNIYKEYIKSLDKMKCKS